MKHYSILIVSAVCLSAAGSLGAELLSSDSIMDRAFDNYPAGTTDLMRTGYTTKITTNTRVQITSFSSDIDWSELYPPTMVVSLELSSLLEQVRRLEEENQSLRKDIEFLGSQIHSKKEGEPDSHGNAEKPPGVERAQ